MLKEDEYNYWQAPSMHEGPGERKRAWIYMVWMTISWEAYEIDTRSYMIDHHRRLWYREQKLQSMPRSQARFIRADWARTWPPKQIPKQQQWSLMGWACGIVHEEFGKLES